MKRRLLLCLLLAGCFGSPRAHAQRQTDSQRNYNTCLHGHYGCDESKLTDSQRVEVQHAASLRNYNACLHGYYGCNQSELTDVERTEVQQAARQRNYSACLRGYFGCDQSKLTDSQRAETQQAAYRRNHDACLHGYYGCDQSKLTDAERLEAQQAANQRNLASCLHGYPSCDQSRLTDSQKESVAKSPRSEPTEPASPPHYYTNSAGERVQSPTYSATVPSGATAQCRDGTYSFSLNHRGTCSHHGGVSRWLD